MRIIPLLSFWSLLSVWNIIYSAIAEETSNLALFWNLYSAVSRGSRILHDVSEGVGAVSKAIHAIDAFLDADAKANIGKEEEEEENIKASVENDEVMKAIEDVEKQLMADEKLQVMNENKNGNEAKDEVLAFTGCGALGFHIRDPQLPMTELTACCGVHDRCYGRECKVYKRQCDGKLKSCLFSACESVEKRLYKQCMGAAKLLFSGTMALSFQQYKDAQSKIGCNKDKKGKDKRKRRR